jgi:hypothetical protein
MANYTGEGAAVIRCLVCGAELRVEWQSGDAPIHMPRHCGEFMAQVTENDGETPTAEFAPPPPQVG